MILGVQGKRAYLHYQRWKTIYSPWAADRLPHRLEGASGDTFQQRIRGNWLKRLDAVFFILHGYDAVFTYFNSYFFHAAITSVALSMI